MIYYKALAGGAQKDNRNAFVGGTGGWAGRLILLTNRNKHNATAFASLRGLYVGEASVGVGVFGNANDIAFISGLTYCMGVAIAVRGPGNQFSEVSVAHFNGGYDHARSWAAIRAGVHGAAGTPYGFIVLTS
ncbi:MAG: hypothetical protein KGL59_03310, partial [Acidobacteriota bacterium]|nr:hypothetical protein [Acidobacteriota bacterium]